MNQPPKKLSSAPIIINPPAIARAAKSEPHSDRHPVCDPQNNNLTVDPTAIARVRDYERISMRVLKPTKAKMVQIKTETGLPQEVLIDALFAYWDDLPHKLKAKILKAGELERNQRLIEGQHKSMRTTLQRLQP